MIDQLPDEAIAVCRAQLTRMRALAQVRLRRLERELSHLEAVLSDDASQTRLAEERYDRQQALVAAIDARLELLAKVSP